MKLITIFTYVKYAPHVSDVMRRYYDFLMTHHNYSDEQMKKAFPDDIIIVKEKGFKQRFM